MPPNTVTEPPRKLDDDYIGKTLTQIKTAQAEQARIEAERTGASKMTARLLTLFGSILSASAIAGFVWVWDAQSTNQAQSSEIERLEERQREHGHSDIERSVGVSTRRVDGLERAHKNINARLDRQGEQLDSILLELRRPRTWGGRR